MILILLYERNLHIILKLHLSIRLSVMGGQRKQYDLKTQEAVPLATER